ncbi:ATP synthase subunit C lysine N-methyltransferase isoform X1 [Mesoplodon densirostris]|uniref:ATP synthase subunit C lysine N-methyltransferase isoform X1 n=1 Tax=Mesoplodon densirostris TaxID=48708 RepID=UPI0028DC62F5|nr:ATP synthase subunit C lysine N-methyltransferase isoform X1 [Mesoplodon densirostris]
MWALESHCPGTPPETLKEEKQSGCVPATSLEGSSLKKSNWGFLLPGIVGGTLVAVYAVATPFITPALRRICLPFVPATAKQIENVVKMLRCRRGPLVDIGSGDGRIVIAAAKEGFTAVGYELNPWLVWYSRYCARREGVQASAKFYISDLWKVTFSQYSNVVIFGVPQMVLLILRCTIAAGKEKKMLPIIILRQCQLCCSWRRSLSLNLRTRLESLLAGSPSHTGPQPRSWGRG